MDKSPTEKSQYTHNNMGKWTVNLTGLFQLLNADQHKGDFPKQIH